MITAYRLHWQKINWSAYYCEGYNYIEDCGTIYATTEERAKSLCPIEESQGFITISEINVYE